MSENQTQSPRVLVVDDNPTNVLLLERSLKKKGYEVLTADSGRAAVEVTSEAYPDLVLLDVMMPDYDGLEVCKALKANPRTAAIPVIFVTARAEPEEVVKAFAIGGSDYITKPFIVSEAMARVSVHLRLRLAEQELLRRNEQLERLSAQLAEMNVELSRISRTDPLTGLLNRRAWQEAAVRETERSARNGSSFSIAMIDVDHFKAYNDSEGHQAGDECLAKVAQCIQSTCRGIDLVGRYGGEEFIVFLPDTDAAGAHTVTERLRQEIWALDITRGPASPDHRVTISIGLASGRSEPWEAMARRADEALYEAKRSGRNRCCAAGDPAPLTS